MSTEAVQRSTFMLISSLKETARTFDLLESHEAAMSKKRSTSIGDNLVSLGLFLYAGYRVIKTIDDAKNWLNILVTPPPPTPMPAQLLYTLPLTFKPITANQSGVLKLGNVAKRRGRKHKVRESSRRKES